MRFIYTIFISRPPIISSNIISSFFVTKHANVMICIILNTKLNISQNARARYNCMKPMVSFFLIKLLRLLIVTMTKIYQQHLYHFVNINTSHHIFIYKCLI